ncbi:hypothetical protein MHL31_09040 [Lutibacter sp. A80]|uniref:hypothetical protein n=1 Tax=Lutibacter sp. A80 TaxID=2918453 RepID=UPI001F06CF0D|nr:hypothetical protein [Lutibacter sp. A80]UMB59225.1 hypothetical protein MHL31_09040 [Lutibacter sp. A80]
MKKKIFLIKRNEKILLEDPNPEAFTLDINKLKDKYPIIEESNHKKFRDKYSNYITHEFTPHSEISYDNIYKIIFSKNLGIIPLCNNFLEHIYSLPPITKIISILNHAVALEKERLIYTEVGKIALTEFERYLDDELDIPSKNPKSLYNLYSKCSFNEVEELQCKSVYFHTFYFCTLGEKIPKEMENIFEFYDLKNYQKRIENKISIINQDSELLMFSPLLYDFNQWSKLIHYEFSIITNEYLRLLFKKKILSSLNQLKNRIGYDKIPNLHNDRVHIHGKIYFTPSDIIKPRFENPLLKYIDFIKNFIFDNSSPSNNNQLISKLGRKVNKKIPLNVSPKKLNSIFLNFFKINMISIDDDIESRIKRFIKNCFDIKPKYSFESKSIETINFLDFDLREKLSKLLYVLNEINIITYNSSRHLYLILIIELKNNNNENIGLSESTLKPLFQELKNEKIKINNIIKEIGFESQTTLKNL